MTTARAILTDVLKFGLNRLAPGETLDPDTAADCLLALNNVVDGINGGKGLLFREVITASGAGVSGATATLGTNWASISQGDLILGAGYVNGSMDHPIDPITMKQYQEITDKGTSGPPRQFAHDGLGTIYFYPAATGQVIKLRTRVPVTEFADLDTDYTLPKGWRSGLADLTTEVLAKTMNPAVLPEAKRKAAAARRRMMAQAIDPAKLDSHHYSSTTEVV